jgi:thiol-disulfide isomerase/thioredoxin
MNRRSLLFALAAVGLPGCARAVDPRVLPALPQDPDRWINSPPLSPAALAARPVLIEFWTFDCSNCRAMQPWMDRVQRRYASAGLVTIGIHTPEFPHERDPAAVQRVVSQRHIAYPVVLDSDRRLWDAFGNHYWPALYLYDTKHRLAGTSIGELHSGDARGDAVEAQVQRLVASGATAARVER